jgi:lysozyme family protein
MKSKIAKLVLLMVLCTSTSQAASFEKLWENTYAHEGSGINYKEMSKHGITEKTLVRFNKDFNRRYTIKTLTEAQAKLIAYHLYYRKYNIDKIKNQIVANNIFDYMFNAGPSEAIRTLQLVINDKVKVERQKGDRSFKYIPVTGVLGEKTIAYANHFGVSLVPAYKVARRIKYRRKGNWEENKGGWTRRINEV